MVDQAHMERIVTEAFAGTDRFLVGIEIQAVNRIVVYIDGDRGVTIDDCRGLSRLLEQELDRDLEDYTLTVSSPGADKPMREPRQFLKHLGRELVVTTRTGATVTGILVHASAEAIELEHKHGKKERPRPNTTIPFTDIREGRVILSFR